MKKRTRWQRVYNRIIGMRFFDNGEYSLGFFTIEKLWHCKEYCEHAVTPQNSHWFDEYMMKVKTDSGRTYKMPFVPWLKFVTADGKRNLSELYDENSIMNEKKPKLIKK